MQKIIHPSPVQGSIKAPPGKSLTQRAYAAALLADGETLIINPSGSNDSLSSIGLIQKLGATIIQGDGNVLVNGGLNAGEQVLDCGESGLAMRMFAPIAALRNKQVTFTGNGSLMKRPVHMIAEALNQLGIVVESQSGFLPFSVKGPLHGGKAIIDGSVSSQLLTGLLMALPLVDSDSEIQVNNLKSKPYIAMTIRLLKDFGIEIENRNFELFNIPGNQKYKAGEYTVEGDWSGAAFLLVAGVTGGSVTVSGLQQKSEQSDTAIIEVLKIAGARMNIKSESVQIEKSELRPFNFDATECPDLFPPLAALAASCPGISRISGVERLLYKESNRAISIQQEMEKLGIRILIDRNDMIIEGGKISGALVNSQNDHRIAMMASVAALGAKGPVTVKDAGCVNKSYPEFFDDLSHLGVKIYSV
jgi:3-phosphoshikimate 1-carboxyvinyltransferase